MAGVLCPESGAHRHPWCPRPGQHLGGGHHRPRVIYAGLVGQPARAPRAGHGLAAARNRAGYAPVPVLRWLPGLHHCRLHQRPGTPCHRHHPQGPVRLYLVELVCRRFAGCPDLCAADHLFCLLPGNLMARTLPENGRPGDPDAWADGTGLHGGCPMGGIDPEAKPRERRGKNRQAYCRPAGHPPGGPGIPESFHPGAAGFHLPGIRNVYPGNPAGQSGYLCPQRQRSGARRAAGRLRAGDERAVTPGGLPHHRPGQPQAADSFGPSPVSCGRPLHRAAGRQP